MIKSFTVSFLIIVMIFASGIFLSRHVKNRTDSIYNAVASLSDEPGGAPANEIIMIRREFDKLESLYILSVKKDYISNAQLCLDNLEVCFATGTKSEYLYAKDSFLCALKTISGVLGFSHKSFL